jgi:hypothetical protein
LPNQGGGCCRSNPFHEPRGPARVTGELVSDATQDSLFSHVVGHISSMARLPQKGPWTFYFFSNSLFTDFLKMDLFLQNEPDFHKMGLTLFVFVVVFC